MPPPLTGAEAGAGAGAGMSNPYVAAAGFGLQAATSLYTMIDANRRLKRLGARPTISTPGEWTSQYKDRLKRSKMYQGYTRAELANMQTSLARNQAGLLQRGIGQYGANPQALLTSSSIYNANALSGIGARSAELNRNNQYRDYAAAEAINMQIGNLGLENQRGNQREYDMYRQQLGLQKQAGLQGIYNMFGTAGTLGYQGMANNS